MSVLIFIACWLLTVAAICVYLFGLAAFIFYGRRLDSRLTKIGRALASIWLIFIYAFMTIVLIGTIYKIWQLY